MKKPYKKSKEGSIWVSAVLYFGLGLIVLTIILTAATPVINRLRDKNIVIQTKEVFQVLDSNIREVAREGPGAQRPLTIDIRKGEFSVDEGVVPGGPNIHPRILWNYDTKAVLAEPCFLPGQADPEAAGGTCGGITEGNLLIVVKPGTESGSWDTSLSVNYRNNIYLKYEAPVNILTGASPLVIRNVGVTCGPTALLNDGSGRGYCSGISDCSSAPTQNGCPANSAPRPTVEILQR